MTETSNSSTSKSISPEVIEECGKFIDRAHHFWHFYSVNLYNHQDAVNKTYLWLSVTLLTAQAAAYSSFFTPDSVFAILLFSVSIIGATGCLLLGLLLMTDLFLPALEKEPGMSRKLTLQNICYWGSDSERYYQILEDLASQYDRSTEGLIAYTEQKAVYLRWQCWILLASLICFMASVILFNLHI